MAPFNSESSTTSTVTVVLVAVLAGIFLSPFASAQISEETHTYPNGTVITTVVEDVVGAGVKNILNTTYNFANGTDVTIFNFNGSRFVDFNNGTTIDNLGNGTTITDYGNGTKIVTQEKFSARAIIFSGITVMTMATCLSLIPLMFT